MNNKEQLFNIKCKATGIGSMPHSDVSGIANLIIQNCPDIPYWPQCLSADVREGMLLQYMENLPCLKLDENNELIYDKTKRDEKLLEFFENYTSGNYNYFKISREFARGFYILLDRLRNSSVAFIKGQVVGPVTLMYSVIGEEGKSILFDEALSDAIIRGLAMKAVWQAKEIKKLGKNPIVFFDEPALSGFGSAFLSLDRDQVTGILNKLIDAVKEHEDVIIGLHCCGNSDWDLLLNTGIDIINFDSFSYSENFIIYTNAIKKFLNRDGLIAWGAVPTSDYNESITLDLVIKKFNDIINKLTEIGINRQFLLKRSLFTPACGMGKLSNKTAEAILELTSRLALHFTN